MKVCRGVRETIQTMNKSVLITVEPHHTNTPEMWPSTIMQILRSVLNAIFIDLHAPEMRTRRYSIKWMLGLAPTVSLPTQSYPHSGHFGNKTVDSLAKQTARKTIG